MIARKLTDKEEIGEIVDLLKDSGLPHLDIPGEDVSVYGFYEDNELVASGAIEYADDFILLRSLAVADPHKNKGLGTKVVEYLEDLVTESGCRYYYIITEIPEYFKKMGFKVIQRQDCPEPIQQTAEFTTFCPEDATVMKKTL